MNSSNGQNTEIIRNSDKYDEEGKEDEFGMV